MNFDPEIKTIREYVNRWQSEIVANILKSGQKATGEISESFEAIDTPTGAKIEAAKFYKVLETGRKPGKMPPPTSLYKWIEARYLSDTIKKESLAYVIARRIGKEGTLLYMLGGRKDIFSNVLSDKNINSLVDAIGFKVQLDIVNNLNKIVK